MPNVLLLEKEREGLVTRMRVAHEEDREEDFKELKEKVVKINDRIADQQFVDEQSLRAMPKQDKEETNLSLRVAQDYDLGKAIQNAKHERWDGLEGEVQQELRSLPANKRHASNAVLIPNELQQRAVTTTSTPSTAVATESFRPQEFLPVLRDKSIAGALGVRMIQGMGDKVRIPKQGAATTAEWQTETGTATEKTMAFLAPIEFEPRRMTYYTQHSDQIVRESGGGLPIQRLIIEEAQRALADKLDDSIFRTGTAQETNAPAQLWKNGSIGSISPRTRTGDTNGKAITYDDILKLKLDIAQDNLPMMRPGFAINPDTVVKLKQTLRIASNTNSDTIIPQGSTMIDGYPTQVSNRVTNAQTKGTGTTSVMFYSTDWQYLVLCTWGSTALIVDPYSSAPSSQVRLVWHQFLDYKILRDEAFGWYDSLLLT